MSEVLTDRTVPEVGKYYRVTCAIHRWCDGVVYVPIIGKHHTDPQFGNTIDHYHVDGRFIKDRVGRIIVDRNGMTNQIIDVDHHTFLGITIKTKKCIRTTTGIIPPEWGSPSDKYKKWYGSYVGRSCNRRVCPHRGAIMHEHNGILICPLHGLHASKETETIIPL